MCFRNYVLIVLISQININSFFQPIYFQDDNIDREYDSDIIKRKPTKRKPNSSSKVNISSSKYYYLIFCREI